MIIQNEDKHGIVEFVKTLCCELRYRGYTVQYNLTCYKFKDFLSSYIEIVFKEPNKTIKLPSRRGRFRDSTFFNQHGIERGLKWVYF